MKAPKNRVEIRPLTEDEGGGYLATFPDLPGCMADGETPLQAIEDAAEAEEAWLQANKAWGGNEKVQPAKLVARLPRSLHSDLQKQAALDGVSLNTTIVNLLSRGLGEITKGHGTSAK